MPSKLEVQAVFIPQLVKIDNIMGSKSQKPTVGSCYTFYMKFLIVFLILGIAALGVVISKNIKVKDTQNPILPISKILPTPFNPFPYKIPQIPAKRAYLTYLVGDSITESLGVNANTLRNDLIALYPQNEFVNYNYGFGSTNILSLNERLTKETSYQGSKFPAILDQGFDLIIIESFAYNPLYGGTASENLVKYEEALDENIKLIIKSHPDSVVAIMTPIAPNKENFAKYSRDLSPEVRAAWVEERKNYIFKAIEYAKRNNLPLINVYEKSADALGNGELIYIDPSDFIHPSKEGIALISKTISDFIYVNNIFPH